MRIGIDIDGVLTDLEQYQLDCGSKFMIEHYNRGIKDGNGYNQKCEGYNIIRCYSWYDIYAKIEELFIVKNGK